MKTVRLAFAILGVLLVGGMSTGISSAGEIKGKVTAQGMRSPENIVVYVDAIAGKDFPAPAKPVLMDQKKMTFVPHVLPVLKGTTVEFLNSDPVGHNVYWPSVSGNKKLNHNLGTWPQGQKKPFQFNDLGAAPLLCNVHPEMSAYIVVSPTPYFAETDASGNFKIANVPAGDYTVTVWHEGGKPQSKPAKISGDTKVDLTVGK